MSRLAPRGAIKRYRFEAVLGKGGFGEVYLATRLGELEPQCAIKLARGDGEELTRLYDEARMLVRLAHPSIVRITDLVRFDGLAALELEFVDGVDLCTVLKRERGIPAPVALEIVEKLSAALEYAWHQPSTSGEPLRLRHRDIKPSNIMLTRFGDVKLLDFGIAIAELPDRQARTVAGSAFATRGYRSPERITTLTCEAPADIYALGAVLYEMLTGDNLGEPGTPIERGSYERWLEARLERLLDRTAESEGLPEVRALLEHMLDYDPASRIEARDVGECAEALRRRLTGRSLSRWSQTVLVGVPHPSQRRQPDHRTGRRHVAVVSTGGDEWTGHVVQVEEEATDDRPTDPGTTPPPTTPPPPTPPPPPPAPPISPPVSPPIQSRSDALPGGPVEPLRQTWTQRNGRPLGLGVAALVLIAIGGWGWPRLWSEPPEKVAGEPDVVPVVAPPTARLAAAIEGATVTVTGADGREIALPGDGGAAEVSAGGLHVVARRGAQQAVATLSAEPGQAIALWCDLDEGVCSTTGPVPRRGAVSVASAPGASAVTATSAGGQPVALPLTGEAVRLEPAVYEIVAEGSGGTARAQVTLQAGDALSLACVLDCGCGVGTAPICTPPSVESSQPPPPTTATVRLAAGGGVERAWLISGDQKLELPRSGVKPGSWQVRISDGTTPALLEQPVSIKAGKVTLSCDYAALSCRAR